MQSIENEQVKKIGNWIVGKLNDYEVIIFILIVIALVLKSTINAPLGIIITLLFLTLSTLFFFSGFADLDDEYAGGIEYFIHKLVSWSLSVNLVGILFLMQHWAFSDLFLSVGSLTLFICIIAIFWINKKKPMLKVFNTRYILRSILNCAIGILLIFGRLKLF